MPLVTFETMELARKLAVLAKDSSKAGAAVLAKPGVVDQEKMKKMISRAEQMILEIKVLQSELDDIR